MYECLFQVGKILGKFLQAGKKNVRKIRLVTPKSLMKVKMYAKKSMYAKIIRLE